MKPDSYMAFDWPKFISATQGWPRHHKWSYLNAICAYYWTDCSGLENDDSFLMQVCECYDVSDWACTKARIFRDGYFSLESDGKWHQKRARSEYAYALSKTESRSKAGRLGGRPKKANVKQNESKQQSKTKANQKPSDSDSDSTLSLGEIEPPPGFPSTEGEAVSIAEMVGVTKEIAVLAFHKATQRGFTDSSGCTIMKFASYLKTEQAYASDRKYRQRNHNTGRATPDRNAGSYNKDGGSGYDALVK